MVLRKSEQIETGSKMFSQRWNNYKRSSMSQQCSIAWTSATVALQWRKKRSERTMSSTLITNRQVRMRHASWMQQDKSEILDILWPVTVRPLASRDLMVRLNNSKYWNTTSLILKGSAQVLLLGIQMVEFSHMWWVQTLVWCKWQDRIQLTRLSYRKTLIASLEKDCEL